MTYANSISSRFVAIFSCMILISISVFYVQFAIDNKYSYSSDQESILYFPSKKFVKFISVTYDEMLADFLWIKLIGYFATHSTTDQDYRWLDHYLNIIVKLDPHCEYVYEIGGIMLSAELKRPKLSNELMKKGMDNVVKTHHRYWKLPFFIAFNYMYYLHEFEKAAHYLEIASKYPESPSYLPLLVSKLYIKDNYHDTAIKFLLEMSDAVENPALKQDIDKRIEEILNDKNINKLENARDQFLNEKGRYPFFLYELVLYGFIKKIPDNFPEGNYYIDWIDHSVFHSTLGGHLELYINNESQLQIEVIEKNGK